MTAVALSVARNEPQCGDIEASKQQHGLLPGSVFQSFQPISIQKPADFLVMRNAIGPLYRFTEYSFKEAKCRRLDSPRLDSFMGSWLQADRRPQH